MPEIETVNPVELLSLKRFDIPVKWRYFRAIVASNDAEAEQVYLWHIEKRRETNAAAGLGMESAKQSQQDYIDGCHALLASMQERGYDGEPIPLDPDGEILGGAHRLACALALGLDSVPVQHCTTKVFAPSWGYRWFVIARMPDKARHRLLSDWEALHGV